MPPRVIGPRFNRTTFPKHRATLVRALHDLGTLDGCLCTCGSARCFNAEPETVTVWHLVKKFRDLGRYSTTDDWRARLHPAQMRQSRDAFVRFAHDGHWSGVFSPAPTAAGRNTPLPGTSLYAVTHAIDTTFHCMSGCLNRPPLSSHELTQLSPTVLSLKARNQRLLLALALRLFEQHRSGGDRLRASAGAMSETLHSAWLREVDQLLEHSTVQLWGTHWREFDSPNAVGYNQFLQVPFNFFFAPEILRHVETAKVQDYWDWTTMITARTMLTFGFIHPLISKTLYEPWERIAPLPVLLADAEYLLARGPNPEQSLDLLAARPLAAATGGKVVAWPGPL